MTKSDTEHVARESAAALPMRTEELAFELPPGMIATQPVEPRDSARMLVVQRRTDGTWTMLHRHVRDLTDYLAPSDLLVFNVTRVLPARFFGRRITGRKIEGLFLDEPAPGEWRVMLHSKGRLHEHDQIILESPAGDASCTLTLKSRHEGQWLVDVDPPHPAAELLEHIGATPLPPYITKARGAMHIDDARDRAWYQTVYADARHAGSVAAPTAGLHFTPELLQRIDAMHIKRAEVILHVGPGTFKPVTAPSLAEHVMHEEAFTVPARTIAAIRARCNSDAPGRVVAVGTTTVRALESLPDLGSVADQPIEGRTRLLIAPGFEFKVVDAMLTNFHLPRSTLLALVAAMVGRDHWRAIYEEAVRRGYRFYSYGDAMLILP